MHVQYMAVWRHLLSLTERQVRLGGSIADRNGFRFGGEQCRVGVWNAGVACLGSLHRNRYCGLRSGWAFDLRKKNFGAARLAAQ